MSRVTVQHEHDHHRFGVSRKGRNAMEKASGNLCSQTRRNEKNLTRDKQMKCKLQEGGICGYVFRLTKEPSSQTLGLQGLGMRRKVKSNGRQKGRQACFSFPKAKVNWATSWNRQIQPFEPSDQFSYPLPGCPAASGHHKPHSEASCPGLTITRRQSEHKCGCQWSVGALESSIEELSTSVCISIVQMKRQKQRAR